MRHRQEGEHLGGYKGVTGPVVFPSPSLPSPPTGKGSLPTRGWSVTSPVGGLGGCNKVDEYI